MLVFLKNGHYSYNHFFCFGFLRNNAFFKCLRTPQGWPKFTMANGKSDTGLRRTSDAGSPHRLGQLSHAPWRGRPCQPVHLYMMTAAIGRKNEFCIFKHSVSRSPMVGDPRLS